MRNISSIHSYFKFKWATRSAHDRHLSFIKPIFACLLQAFPHAQLLFRQSGGVGSPASLRIIDGFIQGVLSCQGSIKHRPFPIPYVVHFLFRTSGKEGLLNISSIDSVASFGTGQPEVQPEAACRDAQQAQPDPDQRKPHARWYRLLLLHCCIIVPEPQGKVLRVKVVVHPSPFSRVVIIIYALLKSSRRRPPGWVR